MRLNHPILTNASFDRHTYSINRPLGTWKARIDHVEHNQGTNPPRGSNGIHLYVKHESGQKIWLFVPFLRGFDPFTITDNFGAGDCIEVEIATSKSGLPAVKKLRKLDRSIR